MSAVPTLAIVRGIGVCVVVPHPAGGVWVATIDGAFSSDRESGPFATRIAALLSRNTTPRPPIAEELRESTSPPHAQPPHPGAAQAPGTRPARKGRS
jgi:hypothetical protein